MSKEDSGTPAGNKEAGQILTAVESDATEETTEYEESLERETAARMSGEMGREKMG
jgi:hypothetical protein